MGETRKWITAALITTVFYSGAVGVARAANGEAEGVSAYIVFDGAKMYEKPGNFSSEYVTAAAGTMITDASLTRVKTKSKKGGYEDWYKGTEPGGKTIYVMDSSLAAASLEADFDGDGEKEIFLYGLDYETYEPGAKSGMIKIIKNGKTTAFSYFEPLIYYDGKRIPDYNGYSISASVILPGGFSPPVKLIKLKIFSENESFPFGDVYFLWKNRTISHCFTAAQDYGPVNSLLCGVSFPKDKGGRKNSVIINETFEYGLDEEPKKGEGSYDRITEYKWDGKNFTKIRGEKKFKKWAAESADE